MAPVGPNEVLINVDNTDKEGRTAIHRAVKARYRNMDSVFREFNGSRFIVVRKKKGLTTNSITVKLSLLWALCIMNFCFIDFLGLVWNVLNRLGECRVWFWG